MLVYKIFIHVHFLLTKLGPDGFGYLPYKNVIVDMRGRNTSVFNFYLIEGAILNSSEQATIL